jgi:hypothetical protein
VGSYYYFAATLPTPQMGAPAPMTSAEYIQRCARSLGHRDLDLVSAAVLVSAPEGPPAATRPSALLRRYYAWERGVRNELVRLRARPLARSPEPWLREAAHDDAAVRIAQTVFGAGSPLEAELVLERERWNHIRSLGSLHIFDREALAAYRLALQILERLALLRQTEGEAHYRETYAAILGASPTTETGD